LQAEPEKMNTVLTTESTANNISPVEQPLAARLLARLVSWVFHPVFVPVYVMAFLIYEHPFQFTGFDPRQKLAVLLQSVAMYLFFPLVTVLLLKALGFIESIQLKKQKDRIIPLVACGVWYFWIWYVWHNLPGYPDAAIQFALAIWISSWTGLMVNTRMKISLHAISMGIAVSFLFLLAFTQTLNFGVYLSIAVFIAGLVCTARFIVSDHTPAEIYGGLVLGALSMAAAAVFG
jgi:hypothetical protein